MEDSWKLQMENLLIGTVRWLLRNFTSDLSCYAETATIGTKTRSLSAGSKIEGKKLKILERFHASTLSAKRDKIMTKSRKRRQRRTCLTFTRGSISMWDAITNTRKSSMVELGMRSTFSPGSLLHVVVSRDGSGKESLIQNPSSSQRLRCRLLISFTLRVQEWAMMMTTIGLCELQIKTP